MLAAAHVLAMDSKNLLDVVDAIRIRFPHVNQHLCSPPLVSHQQKQPVLPQQSYQPEVEMTTSYSQNVTNLPTPVSCTFVQAPAYSQKVQVSSNTSTSNVSTTQAVDS